MKRICFLFLLLFLMPSVSWAVADPSAHIFANQGWQVQLDCTGSTANGVGCWNGTTLCIGNGTSCAAVTSACSSAGCSIPAVTWNTYLGTYTSSDLNVTLQPYSANTMVSSATPTDAHITKFNAATGLYDDAGVLVTTGTGVPAAAAINIGTAGSFVLNGGALGTPSGGTLTNAAGLPAAGVVGTAIVKTQVFTQCTTIKDPLATSDYNVYITPIAIHVTATHCLLGGSTNIAGQFDIADTSGASPAYVDSVDMTCTTTISNDVALNGTVAAGAGAVIQWRSTSVSGTPTSLIACFNYTID